MGHLIELAGRSARPPRARAAFFYDLTSPYSYLAAERLERALGEVPWVPVAGGPFPELDAAARRRAELMASELRLPLVWPEHPPRPLSRALRAAAHASETGAGAGARFALAALRLRFCGGFDLEDPEVLLEAAAAAGLPLQEALQAAGDASRDPHLRAAAQSLRAGGVRRLPAVRIAGRLLHGESVGAEAAALLRWRAAAGAHLAGAG